MARHDLTALERLHRVAAARGCSVGIRSIYQQTHDSTVARLATLDVRRREDDWACVQFRHRQLVATVRIVSLREGVPDLTVEQAAVGLLRQLAATRPAD